MSASRHMLFRIQVLLAFEICAALGALVRPYLGLLLLILLTFARPEDDRPNMEPLHMPLVMTWVLIVSTLCRFGQWAERASVILRTIALYLVLCLLMFVAGLVNGYTAYSAYKVQDSVTLAIVMALILIWTNTERRLQGIVFSLLASGLYYVNTVLRNPKYLHEAIGGTNFERVEIKGGGNFSNPNFLAVLMVVAFFLTLALLIYYHSWWIKAALSGAAIGYLAVFLKCQSRGATLGMVCGLTVFWLMLEKKALAGIVMISIVAAGLSFAPESYFARMKTVQNYEQDKSATGRLEMWAICLDLIQAYPVFGIGPGMFEPTHPNMGQHNAYLQLASETGIPGLLVYLALLASGFRSAWIARRLTRGDGRPLLSLLSGALFCAFVEFTVQGFFTGFGFREFIYVTLAITYAVRSLAEFMPDPRLEDLTIAGVECA